MRENPGWDAGAIVASLQTHYGLDVASLAYLPIGHDMRADVYEVVARDGSSSFLKIRSGPVNEASLLVPRALLERGVRDVVVPLPTRSSNLWCPLDGDRDCSVVLYPYIRGENGKIAGLSDDQWRAFGTALRAVHDSGLEERLHGLLPSETFALPSAALVRRLTALVECTEFESPAAVRLATFWRENVARIDALLDRAEELGRALQAKSFELVLCHTDIHAANLLIGDDGRVWLVDWDSPLIALRERDLLFVIGSRIARVVEPRHENLFSEGYGPTEIDRDALIYYRYERIVEDIGEFGRSVFLELGLSEPVRASEAEFGMSFFAPGGDLDRAETVPRVRWPGAGS